MPSLRELGEIEALRRLTSARGASPGVVLGPGDDAAILSTRAGTELIATTDAFVEGGHFLSGWGSNREIGARLASANLSDLAAMAAAPRWALLSIGANPDTDVDDLVELQGGVEAALAAHGASVVGGNLTAVEGPAWFSLSLLGEAPAGRAWRRSGATAGDWIAVTGFPGRAGAGLRLARALGEGARAAQWRPLLDAWLRPAPRIALALALEPSGAVHAAIDLSDGLAGDLLRLCEASGTSAELEAWPADPELERAAAVLEDQAARMRLAPSDDYELILAVDPERRAACEAIAATHRTPLSFIGRIIEGSGPPTQRDGAGKERRVEERGYDPFA